jgi:peptidoglycan/LPS O-acetylase OafA/YrhL
MNILATSERISSTILRSLHSWFARQLDDRKPRGTIASLDGVRAIAFLTVLLLHVTTMALRLGLWKQSDNRFLAAFFASGASGVTLFFVLSGFLLFLPYAQALLLQKPWPSAKIFYMRRVLRIFPAYYVSLFLLVLFSKPFLLQPHNWKALLPFLTFTMGYSNSALINGPYWTLAVEFQYYLLLPLIALGIAGLTRLVRPEKRLWVVVGSLIAMIIWGIGTRWWGATFTVVPHALLNKVLIIVYGDHSKFLEDFAVGMLLAVCSIALTNAPQKERYLRTMQRLVPGFLLLGVLLYAFSAMRDYSMTWVYAWPFAPRLFQIWPWTNECTFALSYGCAVLAVLFSQPRGLLRRFCEWTPLRWIGLISYSLYIWHEPLLRVIQAKLGPALTHLNHVLAIGLCAGFVLSVSVCFCFFAYLLVEKPGMQLSERLRQQMLRQRSKHQATPGPVSTLEPVSPPDLLNGGAPDNERITTSRT